MAESDKDQAKPLAPLSHGPRSDQPEESDELPKHVSRPITRCILCCGFLASITMLLIVSFIILALTLFHIRNPNLTIHSAAFNHHLKVVNRTITTGWNLTITMNVSVRNPNVASFRVRYASMLVYYGGVVIGEGGDFPAKVPPKRTLQTNLTTDVHTLRLALVPGLMEDLNGRGMNVSSVIRVDGKVKTMKIFKKSAHLRKECTMMYNTSMLTFQDLRCQ